MAAVAKCTFSSRFDIFNLCSYVLVDNKHTFEFCTKYFSYIKIRTARNFQVVFDTFSAFEICSSDNYAQKLITKLYTS